MGSGEVSLEKANAVILTLGSVLHLEPVFGMRGLFWEGILVSCCAIGKCTKTEQVKPA